MIYNISVVLLGWFTVSLLLALIIGPMIAEGRDDREEGAEDGSRPNPPSPREDDAEDRRVAALRGFVQLMQAV